MTHYLITRPEHDDTTYYLSQWSKETISFAQEKGVIVLDLNREKANRIEVENKLQKISPELVVFNGHGDDNTVTGHENKPLVEVGMNEKILKDKIIYAISCKSGKGLGVQSVKQGAKAYIGYDDDFIFFYEPNMISRPCNDKTAKLFLEHSSLFIQSLLKRNNVAEAKKKAENKLRENIVKMIGSNTTDASLIRYLWWDLKHFVAHGNNDAKI